MKGQKGFTLIELMIVVAVIGVLAAIAIPQYQKYVAKAETASALATLTGIKTNAEAYTLEKGEFPPNTAKSEIGVPVSAAIGSFTLTPKTSGAGSVIITFDGEVSPSLKNKNLWLARTDAGAWSCESDTGASDGLLPKGCIGGKSKP